jgi:hypothetical protein
MPEPTIKTKIVRAVEELPESATIEDAIERLVFLPESRRHVTIQSRRIPRDRRSRSLRSFFPLQPS